MNEKYVIQKTSRSFCRLLFEFWRLLANQRVTVSFAMIAGMAAALLALMPPAVAKLIVDNVLTSRPFQLPWSTIIPEIISHSQLLWWLSISILVINILASASHFLGSWLANRATTYMQASMRRQVFQHSMRLPLFRVQQFKSGGVASILRDDVGTVPELISSMLYDPLQAILKLIGGLVIVAWIDWWLLAGALILLPVVFLTHRTWIARLQPLHRDIHAQRQEIDSHVTEAFAGIRVVRAFGRQRRESAHYTHNNHFMARQQLHAWWWTRAVGMLWQILIPLASVSLMLYGGLRVLEGKLTVGDLVMFQVYLLMLLPPLATLVASAAAFQKSLGALDRVLDLLDELPDMKGKTGTLAIRKERVKGHITMTNLSFRYPDANEMTLKHINLDVPSGTTVALVGRSGAGKTTLTNLVARFYDPTAGAVKLNGIDLRDINVKNYHRMIGVVEQDVFLFSGTVADNIGYALNNATLEQIECAARAVNAHKFIMALDKGYHTLVGERGVRLSGGQRQKIAIARAMLSDPKILILDEATSNLDSESEQLIQQSLVELMKDRTCFVIAHRLSTIMCADRIIVIEGGQIVESGTHKELLARCPIYRRMEEMQTFYHLTER